MYSNDRKEYDDEDGLLSLTQKKNTRNNRRTQKGNKEPGTHW